MKLSEMKLAKSMGAAILDMYKMRRKTWIENDCRLFNNFVLIDILGMYKMRRKTRIENYCRLFNHFSLKSIFKIIKLLYYVGINICTKS